MACIHRHDRGGQLDIRNDAPGQGNHGQRIEAGGEVGKCRELKSPARVLRDLLNELVEGRRLAAVRWVDVDAYAHGWLGRETGYALRAFQAGQVVLAHLGDFRRDDNLTVWLVWVPLEVILVVALGGI